VNSTLAAPTLDLKVEPILRPDGKARAYAINGRMHTLIDRDNQRYLYRLGRFIVKVGVQSKMEAARAAGSCAGSPYFWPLVGSGKVNGLKYDDVWWTAQEILPLKRAIYTYDRDEWCAAYHVILGVAADHHIYDIELDEFPDGLMRPHNWTIFRDTPVIYDYGM
jgi:hypothetical protein